jgi:hypothetical protein
MVVYAMCIALARELAVTKKNINNSTIQLHMDQKIPYGNYIIISVMSFNYHFVIDTGVDPYFNHCRPIGLKHAILCSTTFPIVPVSVVLALTFFGNIHVETLKPNLKSARIRIYLNEAFP